MHLLTTMIAVAVALTSCTSAPMPHRSDEVVVQGANPREMGATQVVPVSNRFPSAVSIRAVAPTLPGGIQLGLNVRGTLTVDDRGATFTSSKETVTVPYDRLVATKTRVEDDSRLWFFTYVPEGGTDEQILIVSYPVNAQETEALLSTLVDATGFERRDGVPGGTEFRRPEPRDTSSIAAATSSQWSEFDRRVESTAPSLSIVEPSIEDLRSVSVSLSMIHDDGVDEGRISLMYVGEGWFWLAQQITAALPGDRTMHFTRSHSDVVQGGTCVEVMTAVLNRTGFAALGSDGLAMEVPRLGIVRVPDSYFRGLITAFDQAKSEHGVATSTAQATAR